MFKKKITTGENIANLSLALEADITKAEGISDSAVSIFAEALFDLGTANDKLFDTIEQIDCLIASLNTNRRAALNKIEENRKTIDKLTALTK